jgi:hypothetical protein
MADCCGNFSYCQALGFGNASDGREHGFMYDTRIPYPGIISEDTVLPVGCKPFTWVKFNGKGDFCLVIKDGQ